MKAMGRALASLALAAGLGAPSAGAAFQDPLEVPALPSPLASKSMLQGVARAGPRLVAVGQRGHILVSTDNGASWTQAKVPVSSDLTAVFFVGDQKGWVTGHDGIVLHTTDGGTTWQKQLDGNKANELVLAHMQKRADADAKSAELKALLDEAKRSAEQGADKPFLDLWFADENTGYIVGAYNLIFKTTDGGKTWAPLFDQTDNPKILNLYAIGPAGGDLYVAGEAGLVLKLDPATQRFKALQTPYNGSYFGVVGDASNVILYGLRGNVYRSDDKGKSWAKVDVGLPATIVSGIATPKGGIMLADVGGRIVLSTDGGRTFKAVPLPTTSPIADIAEADGGKLARVGPFGVSVVEPASR